MDVPSLKQAAYQLAVSDRIDWQLFDGSTVVISGATGLIGSCCARALLERNRARKAGIKVIALVRNVDKAKTVFNEYMESDGLSILLGDVESFNELMDLDPVDYIIHAACPTASDFFINYPVETINSIVCGTRNMLEFAKKRNAKMVYVSSMEVYGEGNSSRGIKNSLKEAMVGYVDPLNIRSCYPEGKRMAETYCCSYAKEYGVGVAIARLAQTFGPGISKDDRRVFAMFARSARLGKDIYLKTTGESTRMYVHTFDAVAAIFTILGKGEAGSAYNVANTETYCSIKEMAEMVLSAFSNNKSRVIIEIDKNAPYPPEHHLPLCTEKLEGLGWKARFSLKEMYSDLIECLF